MELVAAREIVQSMIDLLSPDCERVEIGGSIRRGKAEVHDGEIVAIGKPGLLRQVDNLLNFNVVEKAQYGEKQTTRWGPVYRGMMYKDMLVELFITDEDGWGYQWALRTGPRESNEYIMGYLSWKRAEIRFQDGHCWHSPSNDWQQVQKGKQKVWVSKDRRQLRLASEQDFFAVLGMPYIVPKDRSEVEYKKHLQNNRAHKWPDFSALYAKLPEDQALWSDEIQPHTSRFVSAGPCKLLNGESFAAVRDQMALEHYRARLPMLKAEIAQLYAEIAPIWAEMQFHFRQRGLIEWGPKRGGYAEAPHARDKVYAPMDGRDWAYQRLTGELAATEADMLKRWGLLPERVAQPKSRQDEPTGWSQESVHELGFEAMLT